MSTPAFLSYNLTLQAERSGRSKCIAILPDPGIQGFQQLLKISEKMDFEFASLNRRWSLQKPTMIFVYPDILDRQNVSEHPQTTPTTSISIIDKILAAPPCKIDTTLSSSSY
jgi:hypothetical protein